MTQDAKYPQPAGTPPGGGRWTWDTRAGLWQPIFDATDAADTPEPTNTPAAPDAQRKE